jgi:Dolichyl-phosphate-mannose-protein mannosyltransferase
MKAKEDTSTRPLWREPLPALLALGLVSAAGFFLRLYRIGEPLFDFSPVRQYHSALLARGFYEWLLTGNLETLPPDKIIEPPILELLASFAYTLVGGEHLWIPRLLSAMFWTIGAVFVYLIARKMVSFGGALFAAAFFLFDPAGVLPSRAFMPDPLMIMLLVMSVYAILRYHERPTTGRLIVAVVISSLALFVKPGICLFQIYGAFIVLTVYRRGLRGSLTSPHLYLFTLLSLLPVALYYAYGTVIGGFLQGQVQGKVVPQYLLEGYFWRGWLEQIGSMVGLIAFAGAVIGVSIIRPGLPRALLVGLWGGYLLFGLAFTYHIHTHGYYSLQLIPVVALSLGAVWDRAAAYIRQRDRQYYRRVVVVGLMVLAVVFASAEQRTTIMGIVDQAGGSEPFPGQYMGSALIADYEARAKIYREIGEITGNSSRIIYSAPDFGYPLLYHGRIDGEYWPTPDMMGWWRSRGRTESQLDGATTRRELFDDWYTEDSAEYFVVIKPEGWRHDKGLRRLLKRNFSNVAKDKYYLVFDLRSGHYQPGSG